MIVKFNHLFSRSEPLIQFHCDQWPHPYQDICYSNRGINKSERAGKRDELEKLKGEHFLTIPRALLVFSSAVAWTGVGGRDVYQFSISA